MFRTATLLDTTTGNGTLPGEFYVLYLKYLTKRFTELNFYPNAAEKLKFCTKPRPIWYP